MNCFHPKYFNRENLKKTSLHLISHLVFWVWNLVFLAVMYLWLLTQVALGVQGQPQVKAFSLLAGDSAMTVSEFGPES